MNTKIINKVLFFDRKFIIVGVNFYVLYVWPDKKNLQNIVESDIKCFRNLLNYRNINILRSICQINISYVKKNKKKESMLKINELDFYNYPIKKYKKENVNYINKNCNKFLELVYIEVINETIVFKKNDNHAIERNLYNKIKNLLLKICLNNIIYEKIESIKNMNIIKTFNNQDYFKKNKLSNKYINKYLINSFFRNNSRLNVINTRCKCYEYTFSDVTTHFVSL